MKNYPPTFRNYLREEYESRVFSNPNYSLRAYAKSLRLSSSELSKIINNKRKITPKMFEKLTANLDLHSSLYKKYKEQIANHDAVGQAKLHINRESFKVIKDWYHFAILELTKIKGFKFNIEWISKMLGIQIFQTREALERLKNLDMIEFGDDKLIVKSQNTVSIDEKKSSEAARLHQKQILNKATNAIDTYPMSERDQSAFLMAVDSKKLPQAKLMIKKFRRELSTFLETTDNPDSLMYLSVSLFRNQ